MRKDCYNAEFELLGSSSGDYDSAPSINGPSSLAQLATTKISGGLQRNGPDQAASREIFTAHRSRFSRVCVEGQRTSKPSGLEHMIVSGQ